MGVRDRIWRFVGKEGNCDMGRNVVHSPLMRHQWETCPLMSAGEMIEDDFAMMWKFRDEDVHGHRFEQEEGKSNDDSVSLNVK